MARPWHDRIEPRFDVTSTIRNVDAPVTWEQAAALMGWSQPSFAGRDVTPETSMRLSTVYACIRLITGVIASLPMPVGTLADDGDFTPNAENPIGWLLNSEPCPGWSASMFWKYMISAELLAGDQMAYIQRDRNGNILALWPLNPRVTTVTRDQTYGFKVYTTTNWQGVVVSYHEDDVLHIPGEGFDGLRGKSVIGWAGRQGIGIGLAAEEYAGRFFSNGARFDYALTTEKKVDEKRAKEIANYWLGRHQGLEASHVPALLTEGTKIEELTVSPQDSQLLDTRKYQVVDIARAFGVPPVLIGESDKQSSWGTGIEQLVLGFVKFTIKPFTDKIADEVNRKLLTSKIYRRQDQIARYDLTDLERGDTAAVAAFARAVVGGAAGPGFGTINEARRMVGLPKRADGDVLFTFNPKGSPDAPTKPAD